MVDMIRKLIIEPLLGRPRLKLRVWGEVATIGLERIREAIIAVEDRSIELTNGDVRKRLEGRYKKTLVIELLTHSINIPLLPRRIEVQIWSLLIDCLFWAWRSKDPTRPGEKEIDGLKSSYTEEKDIHEAPEVDDEGKPIEASPRESGDTETNKDEDKNDEDADFNFDFANLDADTIDPPGESAPKTEAKPEEKDDSAKPKKKK